MAWIRTIGEKEASGLLRKIYAAARQRAGRVFQIIRLQSLNPRTLVAGSRYYEEVMYGESPLSGAQRQMIAVVVSRANGCVY